MRVLSCECEKAPLDEKVSIELNIAEALILKQTFNLAGVKVFRDELVRLLKQLDMKGEESLLVDILQHEEWIETSYSELSDYLKLKGYK